MIQITLKAKHYYYIIHYLRNASVQQSFSLISRLKTVLAGNNDLEASFTVNANVVEVLTIFKTLTALPEGQANRMNVEMDDLLTPQITAGVTQELTDGIGPDVDGNLPDNAYWQLIAQGITYAKNINTTTRENAIAQGKEFIDQL